MSDAMKNAQRRQPGGGATRHALAALAALFVASGIGGFVSGFGAGVVDAEAILEKTLPVGAAGGGMASGEGNPGRYPWDNGMASGETNPGNYPRDNAMT